MRDGKISAPSCARLLGGSPRLHAHLLHCFLRKLEDSRKWHRSIHLSASSAPLSLGPPLAPPHNFHLSAMAHPCGVIRVSPLPTLSGHRPLSQDLAPVHLSGPSMGAILLSDSVCQHPSPPTPASPGEGLPCAAPWVRNAYSCCPILHDISDLSDWVADFIMCCPVLQCVNIC